MRQNRWGLNRQVQIDGSKKTDANRQVQIHGSKDTGPNRRIQINRSNTNRRVLTDGAKETGPNRRDQIDRSNQRGLNIHVQVNGSKQTEWFKLVQIDQILSNRVQNQLKIVQKGLAQPGSLSQFIIKYITKGPAVIGGCN